jgi:hypothetical protein
LADDGNSTRHRPLRLYAGAIGRRNLPVPEEPAMSARLFAALTTSEEKTLRLIARGGMKPRSIGAGEFSRLQRLGLVSESRTGLHLTELGQQCLGEQVAVRGIAEGTGIEAR